MMIVSAMVVPQVDSGTILPTNSNVQTLLCFSLRDNVKVHIQSITIDHLIYLSDEDIVGRISKEYCLVLC